MKRLYTRLYFTLFACFLLLFLTLTLALQIVDVAPIGPCSSEIGFSTINDAFHRFTGVHMTLYILTDWVEIFPFVVCFAFAMLGLYQWIKRRNIWHVDADILLLGCFYLLVIGAFVFFEFVPLNYRPVLINGCLEGSYPSSTTLLALSVTPTAVEQVSRRLKGKLRLVLIVLLWVLLAFLVGGRIVSGVHWLTDILGSLLISAALIFLYGGCRSLLPQPSAQQ